MCPCKLNSVLEKTNINIRVRNNVLKICQILSAVFCGVKILAAIFEGKFTYVQEWAYRLSNDDVIQHNIYINTAIHFILSYV